MLPRARIRVSDVAILGAVIALPILGALLAGHDLNALFRFPPPPRIPTGYVRFSWLAIAGVVAALALIAGSWILGARRVSSLMPLPSHLLAQRMETRRFPAWGWIALGWTVAWWVLAWTRWPWFDHPQRYTFFPLWLGFIISVNALTQRRTGACMMCRSPCRWWGLFVASALFWWVFEWLNRFVRNWHYLAVEDFGALAYVVNASLCFSTVLPAVAAVAGLLQSYPAWTLRTSAGPAWSWLEHRGTAVVLVLGGVSALVLTGAYPQQLYPAVWVAPLALLLAPPVLTGCRGLAHEVAVGNWRRAATWMIASLICGFFWELWNWHSLAKWIYTVPGVERWHLFEMPLAGYAGYLPFGLECLLVAERVAPNAWITPGGATAEAASPRST